MEYRSVAELSRLTAAWAQSIPNDFDLIAGTPRSGMLVASLLSLHLHLPLTDVDGLCAGRVMASGQRQPRAVDLSRRCKVLIVDDSICSGAAMTKVRGQIKQANLPHEIHYGALIASPEAVRDCKVRLYAEVVPLPRVFEWNIMQAPSLGRACVAFEGVLADDSGAPLIRPSHTVGWIATSRRESRRQETEDWLSRHGIAYRQLRMGCSDWAQLYRTLAADLLIVRDSDAAAAIAESVGKPVFATEVSEMQYPGDYPRYVHVPMRPPDPITRATRFLAYLPVRAINKVSNVTTGRAIIPLAYEDTRHRRFGVPHRNLRP